MMFAANALLVILGCGISMINNIWVILVGRFTWGLGAGSFTVFVPKIFNETAPTEKKGTFGALSQTMCCLGIMTTALMGLNCPNKDQLAILTIDDFVIV